MQLLLTIACTVSVPALAQPAAPQPGDQLAPIVQRMLNDDLLTEAQRREAMIFHGQWEGLGELSALEQLRVAVARHDDTPIREAHEVIDIVFSLAAEGEDQAVDELLNETLYIIAALYQQAGRPENVLDGPNDFDHDIAGLPWELMRAQTFEELGRYDAAENVLRLVREQIQTDRASFTTAADLTAAAQAVLMLARLEGRPAADFHLANELLSQAHEEADPLYWPAYVAEARLLFEHGNPAQAIEAVSQALALNTNASEAWYLLGSMMTRYFNFDAANRAAEKLYAINPHHPLGDALTAQIALRQKDIPAARTAVDKGLERYPEMRLLLALDAATLAMTFDDEATAAALAGFDGLAPGNPLAQFHVGQALADARQYALAEPFLQEAIDRQPGWAQPQLELGQLYMQWGLLDKAAAQLQQAATLDPFHKDITNSLSLAREMLGYDTIETERFIVRYKPGIDEVLARDMARLLDPMGVVFTERFGFTPHVKTQVDLMPDDEHFAVRVTGMPDIWTIAACTGDVVAMTPPRPGPKRAFGTFDWFNVMRHEFTHTVNLGQTSNRVPHWFTEGCAVNMEMTGRRWSQTQLLAECYNNDKLFAFDELNWGFIRPTEDYHRPLAYAQSAWMLEFIEETHGWDKALELLAHYEAGTGDEPALVETFGMPVEAFMHAFHTWAGEQVERWGMAGFRRNADDAQLAQLLEWLALRDLADPELAAVLQEHLGNADVLRSLATRALAGDNDAVAIDALTKYRDARPADTWAHRELTRLAIKAGNSADAIASMRYLDQIEGDAPEYALELARVYRRAEDYEEALHFAERAVRKEPYNPSSRELAATLAVQSGDWQAGAFHIEALALLEPTRSIHQKRLAAVYSRLGLDAEAAAATERAEALEALE